MRSKEENKRKKIFESALRIIAEEGLVSLNMQRLAIKAEIATGTLYLYFKDKSSLLAQMHAHYEQWLASNVVVSPHNKGTFEERFRKTWFNYVLFIQRYPAVIGFIEQYQAAPPSIPHTAPGSTSNSLFVDLILEGQKTGLVKYGSTHVIEALIIGAAHQWVLRSQHGLLPPTTDYIHLAWEMTWKAIQR